MFVRVIPIRAGDMVTRNFVLVRTIPPAVDRRDKPLLRWTPRVGQWETRFKRELAEVVSTVASDDRVMFGGSR